MYVIESGGNLNKRGLSLYAWQVRALKIQYQSDARNLGQRLRDEIDTYLPTEAKAA